MSWVCGAWSAPVYDREPPNRLFQLSVKASRLRDCQNSQETCGGRKVGSWSAGAAVRSGGVRA